MTAIIQIVKGKTIKYEPYFHQIATCDSPYESIQFKNNYLDNHIMFLPLCK